MSIANSTSFIVLAAGKGTRMRSELPKVLHQLCGQSLLRRTLFALAAFSPPEIVVVIGSGKELVEVELNEISALAEFKNIAIRSVVQQQQKGTGDAAKIGFEACQKDSTHLAIVPGDIPLLNAETLEPMFADELDAQVRILSCLHPQPKGFGRIVRNSQGQVCSIVEEKDASDEQRKINEINSSVYLVSRSVLEETLPQLTTSNAQGEFYLTDIVELAAKNGVGVTACCSEDYLRLSGANTRVELAELERQRRAEIVQTLQLAGVTFEDPLTVYIDEGVSIGVDSWIGANTRLLSQTEIGSEVVIEGDSRIYNSRIGSKSHLKLGCYITDSVVAEQCSLGPFVQVRPGTELGSGVKLGNFVEVKKAKMGKGAKANHLAYIGDATVGAGSNIGAGTIFCNYDGVNKHHSELGEKVFVGSNSVLVSPVQLGDNSYVGAGSTITKDVPSGALALGRAKQTNIDGWVAKKQSATKKKSRSE